MDTPVEPKLAPPGAGLPAVEHFVARPLFALRRWTATRESMNALFQRERETIRGLVRSCDAETGGRRVLIRRPRGLEDSSRHWSVWMTLDHLRIVHHEMGRVIAGLSKGVMPSGAASTAAVKPRPDPTAGVIAEYEESCEALLAAVAAAPNLKTRMQFAHPWFGPLNAAGWHALAAGHHGIHRRQIELILQGMASTQP